MGETNKGGGIEASVTTMKHDAPGEKVLLVENWSATCEILSIVIGAYHVGENKVEHKTDGSMDVQPLSAMVAGVKG